jgi:hypothetical protein
MNQAFIFSFVQTLAMSLVIIPIGKRRPVDRKATWGEAIFGSTYVFAVMFVAFGVVPHQWIDHADKELGWRKDKIIFGPFDILKPKAFGGPFPFTMIYLFNWWQKRGDVKPKEVETSTYGRPLVRKG